MNQRLYSQTEMAVENVRETDGETLAHVTEWRPFILTQKKVKEKKIKLKNNFVL